MKTKTILLIGLTVFFLVGASCEKEATYIYENKGIVNFADPAIDGCGWSITINHRDFHPINLNNDFQINGLNVDVKYRLLTTNFNCSQWDKKYLQEIEIINIDSFIK